MSKMPAQRPGKSEQSVRTPPEFLRSVRLFLEIQDFHIDLAADVRNRAVENYFSESEDSLTQLWAQALPSLAWGWLNPPFSKIEPWVRKAYGESRCGANIAVLIPASVGANWWRDWVHDKAFILLLNGRITFVGHHGPYPKDMALLIYSRNYQPEYHVWTWKEQE